MEFCHLHCHTQYSLLDGASEIGAMMDKAQQDGQKAVALTDHGNMFGAFKFVAEANKRGIKAIVGCEFYLVDDRRKQSFLKSKGERDKRYHQLMLAKNQKGYENLSKLCSLGFIDGLYGKFPRIDKELILQYHEGLIATSCCIGAEIPQAIINGDLAGAEKKVQWWLDLLGEDFYIEIQRHRGLENIDQTGVSQEDVNQVLLGFAKKYNIKAIATNDSHYIEEEDASPHDILLCVNTGNKKADVDRFRFSSADFYFKTQQEMSNLFKDVPESIANTMEIYEKIESPQLERDILLPNFPLPSQFKNQSEYMRHLVYEGAKTRYGEITEVVRERIELELGIIKDMGFDGYFLIVQDFIDAARQMGVSVGPGRGSAAGSVVAYCLKITNIDPIGYNLLFERFLNPERISMPDIDIDFDDYGRQQVIDWVVDKYGKNQVAQIITFGTMAAKSSIRDVARVMDLPLDESDRIAKLVPSRPGTKFRNIFGLSEAELKAKWQGDDYSAVQKLQEIANQSDLSGEVLTLAQKLEGSVRNTGIHAAGVIIAPDDLTKFIPVYASKDTDLLVTQFDGSVVEDAGMLKMDFLGLKTLSIIKDAIENIVKRFGEERRIEPDDIPIDDEKTYELFQRGDTIGIFQFESEGMRMNLKELRPTDIEDLIAMNALYRPGPMDHIPSFIRRKHGDEEIIYPHEWLEDLLKPTNGIMVYQEQIMQTAQIMAGYSLGQADMLRRAMGKKKKSEMDRHHQIFVKGAVEKGVDEEKADEIFKIMAKFAEYGFNRSHAAAYSILAFQTAYLKAHYPAEFMASVLTHNKSDMDKINFFLREAKRLGVKVLGPDINESELNFTVNDQGAIRFGLSALKGVGEGPVGEIMTGRQKDGPFKNIFDLTKRLNLRAVNKKCLESLVLGGAFDSTDDGNRARYFQPSDKYETYIEHASKYGNDYQAQKSMSENSLFGDLSEMFLSEPEIPECEPWNSLEKLEKEKMVTGIYISGHPLDDYQLEISNFTNCPLDKAQDVLGTTLKMAGLVTQAFHGVSKRGTGYCRFSLQDYAGTLELALFSEDYMRYKDLITNGEVLYVEGYFEKNRHSDRVFFKTKEIKLLESIGKQMTKFITVLMPAKFVNQALIEDFSSLCTTHKGDHKLKMVLIDRKSEVKLNLMSNQYKVNVDHEFVAELDRMNIKYKLN
ncbi:DNA polymerase III subunit alpha [Portibacter marinus]|uniref:DNA polymerase III subunit alpha n=1 Tax=Portibacter marinus TaxID=2898660 RepID=UPI001F351FC7|nr:DNA polymerase III subunit alpha [Portibacter marinus]